jgi:eukaryotic-like serine/threonine-protein kinase
MQPHSVDRIFWDAGQIGSLQERQAFLDQACCGDPDLRQEVEHLLALRSQADGFLESPPPGLVANVEEAVHESAGSMIGPYKLLEQIGEGGFGIVFMAEQTRPVRRMVAIKVLKPGMDTGQVIARFEAERQALAIMDHPNIAKVLDAGATASGRPYFVMELVNGIPITKYCDEHCLTPRQRLELFVPVCQAIQHAHQKGIIHRDLKPSNVLIALYDGKPVPKVIDFGVAKAAGQPLTEQTLVTGFGAIVGTLEYMSPEQAEFRQLDIDTRSDIYALGVLLYELLAGAPPRERVRIRETGVLETLRIIREEDAPTLSNRLARTDELPAIAANRGVEPAKLTKLVRGELDWIVMKALERDRNRRYETAGNFAQDVQRFLADEPVLACPPSQWYRLRKAVRRNKGPVLAAGLVLVALVAGITGTTIGMAQARRSAQAERDAKQDALTDKANALAAAQAENKANQQAQKRLTQIEKANDILGSIFADLDPKAEEKEGKPLRVIIGERLDQATAALDAEAVGDPLVTAKLQNTLGQTQLALGYPNPAITLFARSLEIRRANLDPDHLDTLGSMNNLAAAYREAGRFDQAIPLFEQTLEKMKDRLGPDNRVTLKTLNNLALSRWDAGKWLEAIRNYEHVRERQIATLGNDHPDTLNTQNNLGLAYYSAGRVPEAIKLYAQVRAIQEKKPGPDHPSTLTTLNNLALAYHAAARYTQAIELFEHVRDKRSERIGADHPDTLKTLNNLALAYHANGRAAEALPLFEQVRDRAVAKLGLDHPVTLTSLNNLAGAYHSGGRVPEAVRLLEVVRDKQSDRLGPDHPTTLIAQGNLAETHRLTGKFPEAIRLYEHVRERQIARLGPDHPHTLTTCNNLAVAYWSHGELHRSIPLFADTLHRRDNALGPDHHATLMTAVNLAVNYRDAQRLDDAAKVMEERLPRALAKPGLSHSTVRFAADTAASIFERANTPGKAELLYRELANFVKQREGADSTPYARQLAVLGMNLLGQDKAADAEATLRECLAIRETKEPDAWTTFNTKSMLGAALLSQKKYADAEPLLLQGFEGLKQRDSMIPREAKVRLTEARERLVKLYVAWGKPEAATKWREELEAGKKQ